MTDEREKKTAGSGPDQWDQYWEHGFLTSCADAFKGNYEGGMRSVWERFFEQLPGGARILDVCTGNGAVAAIASAVSRQGKRAFRIHGIDRARIRPEIALAGDAQALADIRFHAGVDAADLPFPAAHFDAVCGQYALEYTPIEATIAELLRVMRPGATGLFVTHHSESIVLKTAREELHNLDFLFAENTLFNAIADLLRQVAAARSQEARRALATNPAAEKARHTLNDAAKGVSEMAAKSPHPETLTTALGYARRAYEALASEGLDGALAILTDGRRELLANGERLQDLSAAALDETRAAAIVRQLEQAGCVAVSTTELRHDDQRLVGWELTFRLP